jgi:hypothetical protein
MTRCFSATTAQQAPAASRQAFGSWLLQTASMNAQRMKPGSVTRSAQSASAVRIALPTLPKSCRQTRNSGQPCRPGALR